MAPPKGTTNNPNGRPRKGKTLTDTLTKVLNMKDEHGVLNRDAIVAKLVDMAKDGHMGAIREIYNRIEGKIPEHILTQEIPRIVIVDETEQPDNDN